MWEIKAAGIGNLSDARYFAAKGVDWMGFPLDGADPNMNPTAFSAMREWIAGPKLLGEFELTTNPAQIAEMVQALNLDGVQLSPFYPPSVAAYLNPICTVWQEIVLADYSEQALRDTVRTFGNHTFGLVLRLHGADISPLQLTLLAAQYCVVALVDHADQIEMLRQVPGLRGIELRGSAEEKVGFKSYSDMEDIFDTLPDAFA